MVEEREEEADGWDGRTAEAKEEDSGRTQDSGSCGRQRTRRDRERERESLTVADREHPVA